MPDAGRRTKLLPNCNRISGRGRDFGRHIGLLVPVLFRPAVHMLGAYLVALGVVVVFAVAQPEDPSLGTQDQRISQANDATVVMALHEKRPAAVRADFGAKTQRRRVVLIAKLSYVRNDFFRILHYGGEFGVAQGHTNLRIIRMIDRYATGLAGGCQTANAGA